MNKQIAINVPMLARVEGEGALELTISDEKVSALALKIYEPPRLFEKFLEERSVDELLDIVARICGICPVAYQMSATQAIENCFGYDSPDPWLRAMRRLFYCGEWLESHNLHVHFLALPDFFGYDTALAMARDYPREIQRGIKLQGLGNAIVKLLGGRSVHPVGACIGGFFAAPSMTAVRKLQAELVAALPEAEDLLRWTAGLPFHESCQDFISVSLRHPEEYPMNEGRIVSSAGLDIAISEFDQHFREFQVPYSTALHCLLDDQPYLVGPLARVNLNLDRLPASLLTLIAASGINFPSRNMHHSIVARAIEIYFALQEAIKILENYQYPAASRIHLTPRAGLGFGCTEAPRGMLWQSYEVEDNGLIKSARIVPPTSQNQARIEQDLRTSLQNYDFNTSTDELRTYCEMIIRNYDPCISCSTHFLDLRVKHQ